MRLSRRSDAVYSTPSHSYILEVIYPKGAPAYPKDHITPSRMSSTQKKLADSLDIATVLKG